MSAEPWGAQVVDRHERGVARRTRDVPSEVAVGRARCDGAGPFQTSAPHHCELEPLRVGAIVFARSFDRVAGWLRADPPLDPVKIVVELAAASGDLPTRKRRAGARGESIRDYLIAKGLAAGRFEIENNSASEPLGDSVRIQGSQRN